MFNPKLLEEKLILVFEPNSKTNEIIKLSILSIFHLQTCLGKKIVFVTQTSSFNQPTRTSSWGLWKIKLIYL